MKNFKPIHCLLIDDDEEEIEIFKLALQDLEINVTCDAFTNSKVAIENLASNQLNPDCIFLDLHMGKTDGKECLSEIKKLESFTHIPVVILSGTKNEKEIAQLKCLGAHEFIVKAPSVQELKNELFHYFTSNFDLNSDLSL